MADPSVLDQFGQMVAQRHGYAQQWRERRGGKVLGYFCTYFPEEIVYAGGVLPVRIIGSHQPQDVTEPHIYSIYCPFCRDCLAQGLLGRYDYLDGVGMAHSCIHITQAYHSWNIHKPRLFSYYFYMPAVLDSPSARSFLCQELACFKEAVEHWLGQAIPETALAESIAVYNTNRRLLRDIYELRRRENPPLSGAQAMEMVLSAQLMDKREHNELLAQALKELGEAPGREGVRLMLVGSESDEVEVVRLIESLGATVVADDLCVGSRYFWNQVPADGDLLAAMAARYLDRPPCPQKDLTEHRRWGHILNLAREYNVQGVIFLQQKFCDPHEFDIPPLMLFLREQGNIPSLALELDVTVSRGSLRSRIEAFTEMLQLEVL